VFRERRREHAGDGDKCHDDRDEYSYRRTYPCYDDCRGGNDCDRHEEKDCGRPRHDRQDDRGDSEDGQHRADDGIMDRYEDVGSSARGYK
jgi:hypothetical protein